MKNIKLLIIALALIATTAVTAQLNTPQPSPTATIEQAVGLGTVTVEYSRPGKKDRVIFGELVPYNKIWRTGANASTKIEFSEDVKIGGKDVPAGKYAFYTMPGEAKWTVILSKNLELWGDGGYDMKDDQTRFMIASTTIPNNVESFTMDFSHFTTTGANLNLSWEKTHVAISIETNALEAIEKNIEEVMAGPTAGTYNSAARFYLENDKDLDKAYSWSQKACKMRPEAFWYLHQKAKIEAKMGRTKEAIATARESLKKATTNEEGDYGYIINNNNLLKELGAK